MALLLSYTPTKENERKLNRKEISAEKIKLWKSLASFYKRMENLKEAAKKKNKLNLLRQQ